MEGKRDGWREGKREGGIDGGREGGREVGREGGRAGGRERTERGKGERGREKERGRGIERQREREREGGEVTRERENNSAQIYTSGGQFVTRVSEAMQMFLISQELPDTGIIYTHKYMRTIRRNGNVKVQAALIFMANKGDRN